MSKRSIPRTCEHCGKDFLAAKSDVAKGWGRFCSRGCKHAGLSAGDKGTPEWRARRKANQMATKKLWMKANPSKVRAMDYRSNKKRNLHRKPLVLIQAERIAKADRAKKTCTKCSLEQPIADFMRHPTSADKRCTECKLCFYKRRAKWRAANRDKESGYANKRRMRKLGVPGSHKRAEWLALCKQFKNRCVCCREKKPLTKDHVVPISKPFSSDSIENLQPLCVVCNSAKGNRNTIDYRNTPFIRKGQATLFG